MSVTRVRAGNVTRLALSQPLIEENLGPLRKALEECLAANEVRVVFDLHEVAAADSRGLEFLLEAREAVMARAGSFQLADPTPLLREILMATRLDHQLPICLELETAGRSPV